MAINFRHKFAYDNVMKLRSRLDLLTEREAEFILSILEQGRLDEEQCSLTDAQWQWLNDITVAVKKRHGGIPL